MIHFPTSYLYLTDYDAMLMKAPNDMFGVRQRVVRDLMPWEKSHNHNKGSKVVRQR